MEEGFMAYSSGEAVVPPVGTLRFSKPRGDMHVKYGYIKGNDTYVVKVASSFYGSAGDAAGKIKRAEKKEIRIGKRNPEVMGILAAGSQGVTIS
jgi:hypothetical protein